MIGGHMAKKQRPSAESRSWEQLKLWLDDIGRMTTSGERVTESNALTLSVYFACARNIAEDIGKLPLILYRRSGENKERASDEPLYKLLRYSPNEAMSAMNFWQTLIFHSVVWGNGYAEIQRKRGGYPYAIWPMDPSRIMVEVEGSDYRYKLTRKDGKVVYLSPENVLHVPGVGFDGVQGYSIAHVARESIGGALATQRLASAFFGNGAHPGGILKHPGKLSEAAIRNLRETWRANSTGEHARKPAVLSEGMEWQALSIPPEDAQFLETRQFQVEDICRWFRMPPHKVGHLLRAQGWSTLEQTNQDYLTDTLGSWMERIEQEVWRKLVPAAQQEDYFAEHLPEKLLRTDIEKRYAAYAVGVTNGWLSRNEVRQRENLNEVEGLDEYLVPLNMVSKDEAKTAETQPDAQPTPDTPDTTTDAQRNVIITAFSPVLRDAYERILRVEADKVTRASKKPDFLSWTDNFYQTHVEHVRSALHPVVSGIAAAFSSDGTPLMGAELSALAVRHVELSRRELANSDNPCEIVSKWLENRASEASKTEISRLILAFCDGGNSHETR